MYTVKEYHCRPTYRKGDLEAEQVVINVTTYKTRTEAKNYIENKLRGKKDSWRDNHKGNKTSWCGYYTGKTWVHENNGETYRESFTFELAKV